MDSLGNRLSTPGGGSRGSGGGEESVDVRECSKYVVGEVATFSRGGESLRGRVLRVEASPNPPASAPGKGTVTLQREGGGGADSAADGGGSSLGAEDEEDGEEIEDFSEVSSAGPAGLRGADLLGNVAGGLATAGRAAPAERARLLAQHPEMQQLYVQPPPLNAYSASSNRAAVLAWIFCIGVARPSRQ